MNSLIISLTMQQCLTISYFRLNAIGKHLIGCIAADTMGVADSVAPTVTVVTSACGINMHLKLVQLGLATHCQRQECAFSILNLKARLLCDVFTNFEGHRKGQTVRRC